MCIQYCHRYIKNLYLTWEKQVCNFIIFCIFYVCVHSILKNFGLEIPHPFISLHSNFCPPPYLHRPPAVNNDRSLNTIAWDPWRTILTFIDKLLQGRKNNQTKPKSGAHLKRKSGKKENHPKKGKGNLDQVPKTARVRI